MSEKPLTAYEQSVQMGHEMMQDMKRERELAEKATADREMHKRAFRVAFDTLNELYPPVDCPEYFDRGGQVCNKAFKENADNPLARELLITVWQYIGDTVAKQRKESEKGG